MLFRSKFSADDNTSKDELQKKALESPAAKKYLEGKNIAKIVVVPNKLVNIVAN